MIWLKKKSQVFLALIVKRGEKDATLQGLPLPSLAFKVDGRCHSGYSGHSEAGRLSVTVSKNEVSPTLLSKKELLAP